MKIVCCFTGHREINEGDLNEVKSKTRESIVSLIEESIKTFISGGARGHDMRAAETIIELKMLYHDIQLFFVFAYKK